MISLKVDSDQIGEAELNLAGLVRRHCEINHELRDCDGLLTRDGRRIAMTEAGRPLVRAACAVFDLYLNQGEMRHSRAV